MTTDASVTTGTVMIDLDDEARWQIIRGELLERRCDRLRDTLLAMEETLPGAINVRKLDESIDKVVDKHEDDGTLAASFRVAASSPPYAVLLTTYLYRAVLDGLGGHLELVGDPVSH